MFARIRFGTAAAAVVALTLASQGRSSAGEQSALQPWTLEEAIQHVNAYPRDVYAQYVVLQLARREKRLEQATAAVMPWRRQPWGRRPTAWIA